MSQAVSPHERGIEADNGHQYPPNVYESTTRAVGSQRWVARNWAAGKLPTHNCTNGSKGKCVLRSSTGNFKGFQHQDGSGLLKHYAHIEAIRTRSGLIIGDKECYAKGRAQCSKPTCDYKLPLTTLKANLRSEPDDIYDIVAVEAFDNGAVVEFESGETYIVGEIPAGH